MKQLLLATPILLALSVTCVAAPESDAEAKPEGSGKKIYRTTDAQGNPVFSDQGSPAAREVELRQGNTLPSEAMKAEYRARFGDQDQTEEKTAFQKYVSLAIVSPAEEEAIRSNNGDIVISINVGPAARPEHRVELLLDGQPIQQVLGPTQITLRNVDRGAHTAHLRVTDGETNRMLQEGPARTFYVLRASRLN